MCSCRPLNRFGCHIVIDTKVARLHCICILSPVIQARIRIAGTILPSAVIASRTAAEFIKVKVILHTVRVGCGCSNHRNRAYAGSIRLSCPRHRVGRRRCAILCRCGHRLRWRSLIVIDTQVLRLDCICIRCPVVQARILVTGTVLPAAVTAARIATYLSKVILHTVRVRCGGSNHCYRACAGSVWLSRPCHWIRCWRRTVLCSCRPLNRFGGLIVIDTQVACLDRICIFRKIS